MYIKLHFTVIGESIRSAFKFFNFDLTKESALTRNKIIDSIDVNDIHDINRVLAANTETIRHDVPFVAANKNGRAMFLPITDWELGSTITYTIRANQTLSQSPANLCIDFDLLINPNFKLIRHEDFIINFEKKIWFDEATGQTGPIHIRDNNVPLGFNTHGAIFTPQHMSELIDKKVLLALALFPLPIYPTKYIDFDVIEFARQRCLELEVIEQDDIDFIDSESKFLLWGKQHEINI